MFRREQRNDCRPDYSSVAPPPDLNKRQSFTTMSQQANSTPTFSRQKKMKSEDDYFDDDDDENNKHNYVSKEDDDDDEEDDPLDAFMAGIESEVKKQSKPQTVKETTIPMSSKRKDVKSLKGVRDDIESEDIQESYYRYMEENPNAGIGTFANSDDEEAAAAAGIDIEYDEDGNPVVPKSSKYIDPLPSIDHSLIEYNKFEKNFYIESEDIKELKTVEVNELRNRLGIRVLGASPPKPVTSFAHFGFDEQLMKIIRKQEYTQPTPIQAQGIPVVLSGRDLIGIAKTGSGKTAAYIWPMLVHIMDQKELEPGDGPIGLILAPTRELSQQIYIEAKKFGKAYGVSVICAYGGANKYELSKDMEAGAEIIVATPGRMIDMIKMKATNLRRVTMLVLDEADRMFDMGFEVQVRSICDHVRPDRQCLMFSATFKKKVERVARDVLTDPIKVIQGELGEANEDVEQIVKVLADGSEKWEWLNAKLVEFTSNGSVLIFVTKKANAEELANNLKVRQYELLLIHGDMEQAERNK
ncbi:ATP-dependent RNA helicase DDX42-like protein, partial [Leptotrombidium deliense]